MNTESTSTSKPASKPAVPLAVTVLVTGTVIGGAILKKGHQLRLPKEQAETLAGLTPPAVRIDGI